MAVTTIDPKTALVLIDLQYGIVSMDTAPHKSADVVIRSSELADRFRSHGAPVVLVHVQFAPGGANAVPGRTEVKSGAGGELPDNWSDFVDGLSRGANDIVVTKHNWGAFFGTDLDVQLRRRGITQIVLAGIATSMGVESTGRAAWEHGYNVTFVSDAMADRDGDNHAHSVSKIFPRLGEIGTTEEVIALLDRSHQ